MVHVNAAGVLVSTAVVFRLAEEPGEPGEPHKQGEHVKSEELSKQRLKFTGCWSLTVDASLSSRLRSVHVLGEVSKVLTLLYKPVPHRRADLQTPPAAGAFIFYLH